MYICIYIYISIKTTLDIDLFLSVKPLTGAWTKQTLIFVSLLLEYFYLRFYVNLLVLAVLSSRIPSKQIRFVKILFS